MSMNTNPDAHSSNEIERLTRALKTLSSANRTLIRATDEKALLQAICDLIVEHGYRMAWAGCAQHDAEKSIKPIASAGAGKEYLEEVHFTWDDSAVSATPVAIRTGKPQAGRNILTDPTMTSFRAEAQKHGFAAASAYPLHIDGKVYGNLTILSSEPDAFDDQEFDLLTELAEDLSFGIQTLRLRAMNEENRRKLEHMAFFDPLTGLPNRLRMSELLNEGIAEVRKKRRSLALLYLEVGRFREINETLGYREGDRLLQEVGKRLSDAMQEAGPVARVGEAEFAILLVQADVTLAERVAQKALLALYEPVELSGLSLDARASVGIAMFPGHGREPDVLIRRASLALYQAKRSGQGSAIYAGALEDTGTRRLTLLGDLRGAVEKDEMRLYCQPKVTIATGEICGAEALVRWQHPQEGIINPGEFISLAESAGVITSLTYWMLDAALAESYSWREAGFEVPLAVNLSARDLTDTLLLDHIKGAFTTWGANPSWIQFELTESALMEDPTAALVMLQRLKDFGVQLCIDDFGTGYSSLSYLQKLPIDIIKIDQSFVSKMVSSPDSAVIVHSTIDLAHNLNLKTIAEGIEDEETWKRLAELNCDIAQGYYISEPVEADRFKDWALQSNWKVASADSG